MLKIETLDSQIWLYIEKQVKALEKSENIEMLAKDIILHLSSYLYVHINLLIIKYLETKERELLLKILEKSCLMEQSSPNPSIEYINDLIYSHLGIKIQANMGKHIAQYFTTHLENSSLFLNTSGISIELSNLTREFGVKTKNPYSFFTQKIWNFTNSRVQIAHPHIMFHGNSKNDFISQARQGYILIRLYCLLLQELLSNDLNIQFQHPKFQ